MYNIENSKHLNHTESNINSYINSDIYMDTDWIEKFEKEDTEYSYFYKEMIETISINFIYINKQREIETIHKDILYLDNGILKKELLYESISNNKIKNKIRYKAINILKYFINLEPLDVKDYLLNIKKDDDISKLEVIDKITNIKFDESITILHDLIGIYILFLEVDNKIIDTSTTTTKNLNVNLSSNNCSNINTNIKHIKLNLTKRINTNNKIISTRSKTKRNYK
jgi:hypothetical protein